MIQCDVVLTILGSHSSLLILIAHSSNFTHPEELPRRRTESV